ncbi:MAG: exonuclease SbcCD subunit D, partial [Eubacteriales bacterium]
SINKAQARINELRGTFTSIMMYAKIKKADIVIIAGDLFDREFVTKDTIELISREARENPSCRFVISPGNHDPITPSGAYMKTAFPENVYIFKEEKMSRFSFDDIGVDVYGYAFTSEEYRENPFLSMPEKNANKINILAAHADISGGNSPYCPISERDIEKSGFDYIALGHIHAGSEILRAGKTYYAYPGCPEGRSFDECGIKGGIFITAEKDKDGTKLSFERPRFSKRRYEKISVDVTGLMTHEKMCEAVKKAAASQNLGSDTLLRVKLTGLVRPDAKLDAEKTLAKEIGVFHIEINDATFPLLDTDGLKSDLSVKGALFRTLLPLLESEDENERKKASLALKYGLSALVGADIADFDDINIPG